MHINEFKPVENVASPSEGHHVPGARLASPQDPALAAPETPATLATSTGHSCGLPPTLALPRPATPERIKQIAS